MKSLDNLIPDIYARLDSPMPFSKEEVTEFGKNLADKLSARLAEERADTRLRLSNWNSQCKRQLYLKINMPHLVEALPPKVRLKFLMGDICEEVLLFLAKVCGYRVEGEQDELSVGGVPGHRDAVIEGRTVDAKSASPYGFRKFATGGLKEDDPFGYIGQLESYVHAGRKDDLVTDKDRGSFLVQDKVSGELCLDTYVFPERDLDKEVEDVKAMLDSPELPPRGYEAVPMGKSGNMKLGVACSYCPVKAACWPGLRAFAYSTGPVFLTEVVDTPRVPEIPLEGLEIE